MKKTDSTASTKSTDAIYPGMGRHDDVVEFPLLLPANRARALVDLSRERRQSVGQILRLLIDQELALVK